jgi:N,N'-diacetyllegionaminate synthase
VEKVLIIAEAGVNHNGSMDIARKLVDVAAESGVDIVKFQTFKTENLVSKDAKKAEYQVKNTQNSDSQFSMLKKLELSPDDHKELIAYCAKKKIQFLSTAFDLESLDLLVGLGIELFKVPSGEITNYPYLRQVGSYKKKVILSTGMSTMKEIGEAIKVLVKFGTDPGSITVLHCNTEYPTPMKDVNLLAMNSIKKEFNVEIGYSDHTPGIEVPIAAVALGATIIEKHFTLDKNMKGPDHKASLDPHELKTMVIAIRNIEKALGKSDKVVSESEEKNIKVARKSIHLVANLTKGHVLAEKDLLMKRPGDGISPMEMENILGKKIKNDLAADHKLRRGDLE